ncbi:hypothetical protein VOLCADRAFT_100249 [Volvox carteri f. nagariensis]|uniref:Pherophorin domain-containing protein n=1 Tax=Volvox carteri f. nagariensis TaxID=3068 RepID=D8UJT8_VOLCA|nr:uncharacterized protein VOLCADRAFT_100249 [Volvox carteri f. nagariensis]EFJ40011.1 hypothetical protein VOLCADRAFT_100249 [Volvox carteri f. nagariensis]|eukprot:XP_002958931.1 hypothetical protein VOLCADRAFT_100249 [Volvox carteri f. nagariensis]
MDDISCVSDDAKRLQSTTINGEVVTFNYRTKKWKGEQFGLLIFDKLDNTFPVTPATGLRLCMVLQTGGSCSTPAGMCQGGASSGSCVYLLSDAVYSCCAGTIGCHSGRDNKRSSGYY